MPTPRYSILIASTLLSALQMHAAETAEVTTETKPVVPPAEAAAKPLSETLDPTLDTPLPTDLPADKPAPPAAPSTNVTINLINRLVQKGILTQAEAAEMIKQAEADAATAAAKHDISSLPPEPSADEEMKVTYIPEVVRNQMRDQIKQELMAQAREEKWSEKSSPDWTSRFRPFGDIRTRGERSFFPEGNDDTGAFTNFNSINNGSPFDASGTQFPPSYNVDQDRTRTRLRARIGTEIMLGDNFDAGVRLATGENNSPVSPNQTLGGSGGNFSKYSIWLDRAFLSYDFGPGYGEELKAMVGRFDNPFFSTDMHWDNDLGFDGLAARGKVKVHDKATLFFAGGYFPVYNTDFNFASNQPQKFESTDKWLTGAQIGVDWKIADDWKAKFAFAYYNFSNIQGELSKPYTPTSASDAGNTDSTRPGFAQRGNSYMPLRNITPTAANNFGTTNQYQYYGLASEFENLTVTGKLEYLAYDPITISLIGEATKNIAFNKEDVADRAYSDGRIGRTINALDDYEGGDFAWYTALQVGMPALEKFGDWQAAVGYRYVESDAVVDGFTDSDFGGGGTNVQGFTLGGNFALSQFVRLSLIWMSSDQITGPPLRYDTLQFDINAKF
ncbi:MAG: putative porin [Gloeobacteraceae cyanobacterium ES-bin-144]|nr:putative porin [Verrucomicrobiales bacterium]